MKSILKKIVSRVILKRLFLFYNTLRINTVDRLFFPALKISDDAFYIKHEKNPFLEQQIRVDVYTPNVREALEIWMNPAWTQDEYLLKYDKGGYIEPELGWGVSLNRKLIYPSLGFARAPYVRKPDLLEYYSRKRNIQIVEHVISLRDTGEENYFHFFNDVLAKIFFLQEEGISLSQYTLVVSENLYKKEYFQFFYSEWKDTFTWHIQKGEWIQFRTAIFCKPYTHSKKFLQKSVDIVRRHRNSQGGDRRIFLTRNRGTLRFIENEEEILNILKPYGFAKMDTSDMSFLEQVTLFSETSHLIAVHGAGITNILFGSKMSILEIHHVSEYMPFHYIMLASLLGFNHEIILGSQQLSNGGFVVDPRAIISYLQRQKLSNT